MYGIQPVGTGLAHVSFVSLVGQGRRGRQGGAGLTRWSSRGGSRARGVVALRLGTYEASGHFGLVLAVETLDVVLDIGRSRTHCALLGILGLRVLHPLRLHAHVAIQDTHAGALGYPGSRLRPLFLVFFLGLDLDRRVGRCLEQHHLVLAVVGHRGVKVDEEALLPEQLHDPAEEERLADPCREVAPEDLDALFLVLPEHRHKHGERARVDVGDGGRIEHKRFDGAILHGALHEDGHLVVEEGAIGEEEGALETDDQNIRLPRCVV
mmetsp:Transcript_43189/g.137927  ORF Transcript_43189/g.137927 Transcript_43189/m.137927 type:complete len:266 (-) Transcript_43189:2049-2846(-)